MFIAVQPAVVPVLLTAFKVPLKQVSPLGGLLGKKGIQSKSRTAPIQREKTEISKNVMFKIHIKSGIKSDKNSIIN